jgi:hypothetical protein
MAHALSSSVAQFSLLSLSFFFTEVAVLSVQQVTLPVVCNIPVFQGNASSLKQVLHSV